jgi:hypothetical protein
MCAQACTEASTTLFSALDACRDIVQVTDGNNKVSFFTEVGGPQIRSANRKSANLRINFFSIAELPKMWQFADFRFVDHIVFFAIFGPNDFLRV